MHEYHQPHMIDGALYAASGYIAIRAERGRWMASDFDPAPEDFARRLTALPWGSFPADSAEWREMDEVRGNLFRFAAHGVWRENHTLAPSPVWQVGGQHLIRLSHLQHLSRLPRCEVYAGSQTEGAPAFFRYNGGTAIVPQDRRLTAHSFAIFAPQYHILDQYRLDRVAAPKPLGKVTTPYASHLKEWPPSQPSDD